MDNHSHNVTASVDLFAYLRSRIEENMPPHDLARMRAEEAGGVIDEADLDAAEAEIRTERKRAARKRLLELAARTIRELEEEQEAEAARALPGR